MFWEILDILFEIKTPNRRWTLFLKLLETFKKSLKIYMNFINKNILKSVYFKSILNFLLEKNQSSL